MLRDDDKVQLVIKDLHEGDAGEITCELVNKKGREAATCKLGVQGKGSETNVFFLFFFNLLLKSSRR